jgi:cysteinyl-tRNA synthetase
MVNLSGKKMSKSEGNIKLLNDYISMFDGNTIRYFFLRANYRKPQEFSENLLHESDKTFKNIITFIGDATSQPIDEHLLKLFEESMNDDLNTPKFIGEMFNYMNLNANKNEEKTLGIRSTIRYIFETLGFVFTTSDKSQNEEKFKEFFIKYNIKFSDIDSSMSNYLSLRQELRDKKEYESADNMRKDIEDIGIIIEDGIESGWRWSTS